MVEEKKEVKNSEKPKEMTKRDAFGIVSSACSQFRGTMQDHQLIQKALGLLMKDIKFEKVEGGVKSEGDKKV